MRNRPLRKIPANRSPRFISVFLALGAFLALSPFAVSPAAAQSADKPGDLTTAIIRVAKQSIPAVAHIEVTERQEVQGPSLPFQNDPFFRRFFNVPKSPKKFRREVKGLGSGILIDAQGHILTNDHVVGGATKIDVTLANGDRYTAKLVGTDPRTDLAVISIPAKDRLPFLAFGNSDKLEVGEWVVAIGHPRGLSQTVTQGIISAMHRRGIMEPTNYQDFLQTDAPINPGNSGGPLLNLQGQVIGVNSVIASESGGFEGIGFSIPSNMAKYVSQLLITKGKVERGWLGVSIQDLTPELAKNAGLPNLKGAYVAEVVKGGPADRAGFKKGDVILAYQRKEVTDSGELRNLVAATSVGQESKVTVWRDGKKQELTVRIESLESSTKFLASAIKERLGISVRPLSKKETDKYGLEPNQGVAIVSVESKGPFGEAGFEVSDIILDINGQTVDGYQNFVDMAAALKPKQRIRVLALDHRTGNTGYINVTVR